MLPGLFAQTEVDTSLPWWAILFWLWFGASLCVYLYRIYRRFTRGKVDGLQVVRPHDPSVATGHTSLPGGLTTPPPVRPDLTPPLAAPPPSPPPRAGRPPSVGHSASAPEATAVSESSPFRPRSEPSPPATGDGDGRPTGRRGLFAPSEPAATTPTSAAELRPPVAQLLKGISMPCDLAPVIGGERSVRADVGLQVAFSTSGIDAAVVGRSVGDELERLGFALESLDESQVEARRDDGTLLVSLITSPGDMKHEGRPAFPTLPPTSLVVVFESI